MKASYTYLQPTPDADGRNMLDPGFDPPPEFYVIVVQGTVRIDDGASDEHILEAIWQANNIDSRPRGQEIRSMCIGDLVIVQGQIYRAEVVGFKPFSGDDVTVLAGKTLVRHKLVAASSTPMEDHYYEALPVFRR